MFKEKFYKYLTIILLRCDINFYFPAAIKELLSALLQWFFIGYWINTGCDFYHSPLFLPITFLLFTAMLLFDLHV
jgi:hypothetical protein